MQQAAKPVRAAQYVRMSTERQIYSIDHQLTALAAYALERRFEIVRSYIDEGRSGLTLKRRDALQSLLSEALAEDRSFDAILVYDVSRWGRFQDADESAHYEFICRQAGVSVHYCGELFENDGTIASTILKSLKRAMAGEYSRDLSAKVWHAQCRLAASGHKMGGSAPYGMRRLLLDENGAPKGILLKGQQKNLRSDRVTLIPGPADELAVVRRIFRLSGERGLTDTRIATLLNRADVSGPDGKTWNSYMIGHILKNENYLGTNVFNRTASKLRGATSTNPRKDWVRCPGAFESIIDRQIFEKAQLARYKNRRIYSDDMLIEGLRRLLQREGKLSSSAMQRWRFVPSFSTYIRRFGSLENIYRLVGYDPRQHTNISVGRGLNHHVAGLIEDVVAAIVAEGGDVQRTDGSLLTIDETIVLRMSVGRCVGKAKRYWSAGLENTEGFDYALIALMDRSNAMIAKYYLVPRPKLPKCGRIAIYEPDSRMKAYRLDGLRAIYERLRAQRRERANCRPIAGRAD